ncbi:hypothetical protein [Spirochaeta cellobiosiphila]|uniref:hypothetical protein n=1 Tax=Spirochaeta cellobiosiphila TaxID=504483 RepID=UPI000403474A|nr:hypothetical protein [Spirochaeta cellobiosiphila]
MKTSIYHILLLMFLSANLSYPETYRKDIYIGGNITDENIETDNFDFIFDDSFPSLKSQNDRESLKFIPGFKKHDKENKNGYVDYEWSIVKGSIYYNKNGPRRPIEINYNQINPTIVYTNNSGNIYPGIILQNQSLSLMYKSINNDIFFHHNIPLYSKIMDYRISYDNLLTLSANWGDWGASVNSNNSFYPLFNINFPLKTYKIALISSEWKENYGQTYLSYTHTSINSFYEMGVGFVTDYFGSQPPQRLETLLISNIIYKKYSLNVRTNLGMETLGGQILIDSKVTDNFKIGLAIDKDNIPLNKAISTGFVFKIYDFEIELGTQDNIILSSLSYTRSF